MDKKEEKYLENKLTLIRAIISGTVMGTIMFPPKDGKFSPELIDKCMEIVENDVRNVANFFKKRL